MLPDTITRDIVVIQLPYNRTADVLRAHRHQSHIYSDHVANDHHCNICCNNAIVRHVHVNAITTLLCKECCYIRSAVVQRKISLTDMLIEMETLHMELPALRFAAITTFRRLLYCKQLIKSNEYKHTRPCVLCHCTPTYLYTHEHHAIPVCDICGLRACKNIEVRKYKGLLGRHVIARIQHHDMYASINCLYLALLWDIMLS